MDSGTGRPRLGTTPLAGPFVTPGICDVTLDRERKTITVHRSPEADPGLIPVFLEGSVLAHALTAEGRLVLHSSAVEVEGVALAIVGSPGAGKSTLAALPLRGGRRLVADDALRVDATDSGAMCFPGSLGLRLRPAAASLSGRIEGAAVRRLRTGGSPCPGPFSRRSAEARSRAGPGALPRGEDAQTRRLGAMEGLQELLSYPRLTMWRASEPIGRLFELTAEVAEGASALPGDGALGSPPGPRRRAAGGGWPRRSVRARRRRSRRALGERPAGDLA